MPTRATAPATSAAESEEEAEDVLEAAAEVATNVCVLRGRLSRPPSSKVLNSGDRLGSFEVTMRYADEPTESVNVVWFEHPELVLKWEAGLEVVVVGRVRRRFFHAGVLQSRTEVVADEVLPVRQAKRVAKAWGKAMDRLAADGQEFEA